MRHDLIRPLALMLGIALALPSLPLAVSTEAAAQAKPAGAPADDTKQVALPDGQVEAFLAAKPDMDAAAAKLPEQASDQPDPKAVAVLDGVAKTHKLAGYGEYVDIASSIGVVLSGIDPDTKTYVGSEKMIQKQIAEVQADKSLKPKDRKDTLDELNAELKAPTPVKVPGNIDVVVKHYDKLSAATRDEE